MKTDEIKLLYEAWSDVVCGDDEGEIGVDENRSFEACVRWCDENLGSKCSLFVMQFSHNMLLVWKPHERNLWDKLDFIHLHIAKLNRDEVNRTASKKMTTSVA